MTKHEKPRNAFLSCLTLTSAILLNGCTTQNVYLRYPDLEQQILQETSKNQTVMFGETHSENRNPLFDIVIPLFPKLKEQGFNYLAVEIPKVHQDLVDLVSSNKLSKKEYLFEICRRDSINYLQSEGFYSVIRAAGDVGIKVVAYDVWNMEDDFSRDEKEFNNLKELIFRKDSTAKVLIYCGAGHISERDTHRFCSRKRVIEGQTERDLYLAEVSTLGKYLSEYTTDKNFSLDLSGNLPEWSDKIVFEGRLVDISYFLKKQ